MSTEALQTEIVALKESLKEAHEICLAIRHGEVDAVVVGQDNEEKRVLLLSGAYARYRQLVEEMQQGAVTLSPGGDILFANQSFAGMLGEQLVDLFRGPLEKYVAPADRSKLAALLAPKAAQRNAEVTLLTAHGNTVDVRLALVTASEEFTTLIVTNLSRDAVDDEALATLNAIRSGAVDAFVVDGKQVVLLDIAKSPYRALVERMRQGAVTVGNDGIIVYANERFSAMIALPHGRILGGKLSDFVSESDRATLQDMLAARDTAQGELKLRAANGERPAMQVSMTSMDAHKLFLFADMTEQKRHQASDERTRKFLGMLAHEFRNILGPINNSVVLLKDSPGLDADAKKAVEVIERQTGRLLGLVEDLRRVNPRE